MTLHLVGGQRTAGARWESPGAQPGAPSVAVILCGEVDADSIDYLLGRIVFVSSRERFEVEVLVVGLDGSDEVRQRVRAWQGDFAVRWVAVEGGLGTTAAAKEAARTTDADILVILEPDLSYPPEAIPRLVHRIADGESDLVIGNRFGRGASGPGPGLGSRILAKLASCLAWPLLGTRDPGSRFIACRRQCLLERASDGSPGPLVGIDLLAEASEATRVIDVDVPYDPPYGAGGLSGYVRSMPALQQLASMAVGRRALALWPAVVRAIGAGVLADLVALSSFSRLGLPPEQAQLAGFLMGTVVAFAVLKRRCDVLGTSHDLRVLFCPALVVACMSFLMRWAVIATLVARAVPYSLGVAALGVGASSLTMLLGILLFALQDPSDTHRETQNQVLFAGFLVLFSVALRGVFSAGVLLIKEESYYWNYAQHLALSYFDHPPLVGWLIALSTALLGDNEFAVRLPAMMSWLVTTLFLFGLARNLSSRRVAARTVVLLTVLPVYFGMGLIITPDSPLHATWAGCLYFLERALLGSVPRAWWGFGVCLGLGLLSKYSIVLLLPALLVFVVVDRESRRWLSSWRPSGSLLVGALFTMPILLWNHQNDWASLLYQGPQRWKGPWDFGLGHLILAAAVLLTPVGLAAAVRAVGPWSLKSSTPAQARLGLNHRQRVFAFVFTWVPMSVFVAHSLIKLPKINWTGPVWLMALPLIAAQVGGDSKPRTGLVRTAALPWSPNSRKFALIMLLLLGSLLQWRLVGSPGLDREQRGEFPPWAQIGPEVGRLRAQVQAATSKEPIVVGMDTSEISGQLSFYDPLATPRNTAGRHLLGRWSEGFRYWVSPDEIEGRDLIMIAFDESDLEESSLAPFFEGLAPVLSFASSEDESTAVLHYRVGYSYLSGSP